MLTTVYTCFTTTFPTPTMKFFLALTMLASTYASDECSVDASSRMDCGELASDANSCEVSFIVYSTLYGSPSPWRGRGEGAKAGMLSSRGGGKGGDAVSAGFAKKRGFCYTNPNCIPLSCPLFPP